MYTVGFDDGSVFEGGNLADTKWNLMPNKPIKTIYYKVTKKTLVLEGFEAYNHLVERVAFVQTGQQRTTKVILMAKRGEEVISFIYDFKSSVLTKEINRFGKEYNGQATTGWKEGVIYLAPKIRLV